MAEHLEPQSGFKVDGREKIAEFANKHGLAVSESGVSFRGPSFRDDGEITTIPPPLPDPEKAEVVMAQPTKIKIRFWYSKGSQYLDVDLMEDKLPTQHLTKFKAPQ